MSIKEELHALLKEINERIKKKESLQKVQKLYSGRNLILNVEDDAYYRFNITSEDINFEIMKEIKLKPTDMYIKMDKDRVIKFLDQKKLRLADIQFIEHRNITIKEIKLFKELQF